MRLEDALWWKIECKLLQRHGRHLLIELCSVLNTIILFNVSEVPSYFNGNNYIE